VSTTDAVSPAVTCCSIAVYPPFVTRTVCSPSFKPVRSNSPFSSVIPESCPSRYTSAPASGAPSASFATTLMDPVAGASVIDREEAWFDVMLVVC